MTAIKLVVSDVDGTLVPHDKRITDTARTAVDKLHTAGIGFTVVSSRPTVGMDFLIKPLALTLPFGSFNGSSIIDPQSLRPIEQHLIPEETARRAIDLLEQFGVEIWLFTNEQWLIRDPHGEYVAHEQRAIRHDPVVGSFQPHLGSACKIVGASSDPERLMRCEGAMRQAVGTRATAVRSQTYYLDITPPGHDKGTFVAAMEARLGVSPEAVATIGDMQNDLPMFARSRMSFAMGNAADEIKRLATHVTASNEEDGFAKAIEMILAG
jgi:Cof subfamily protein (haloacid dehalogenase superfamily)